MILKHSSHFTHLLTLYKKSEGATRGTGSRETREQADGVDQLRDRGNELEHIVGAELTGVGYRLDIEGEEERSHGVPKVVWSQGLFFLQYLKAPRTCPPIGGKSLSLTCKSFKSGIF